MKEYESNPFTLSFGNLEEYFYRKVWTSLSEVEQKILRAFKTNDSVPVSHLLSEPNMKKEVRRLDYGTGRRYRTCSTPARGSST